MDKHPAGFDFGQYQSKPVCKKVVSFSQYLPMQDGVRIALTVMLPGNLGDSVKVPALLYQTRYWREFEGKFPFNWLFKPGKKSMAVYLVSHGYAMVRVDVRGTGASFGVWHYPWHEQSIEDAREIVDWIIAQPWSNGKVGGLGGSYSGTTAELLAVLNHPAVRAVVPMYNHPDPYTDISHPGGLFNQRFLSYWSKFDFDLDHNRVPAKLSKFAPLMRGVKPVDEDRDRSMLKAALKDHEQNGEVEKIARGITFRDQVEQKTGKSIDCMKTERFKRLLETSPTAIFGWASWMDAATADAAMRRFHTLPNAVRVIIGPWTHGGIHYANPYRKGKARKEDMTLQFNELLRFLDAYLKNDETTNCREKSFQYYTQGEDCWKQSPTFPPADTKMQRWFLHAEHQLSTQTPGDSPGEDEYVVDFEATSGLDNRWWEFISFEDKTVRYLNRKEQTPRLLCYQSAPLPQDMEIAGQPIVNLWMSVNHTDCEIYVYLEDVDENGEVTYITEGQLRGIHRKISDEPSDYVLHIPYHTFKEKDALPIVPGEITSFCFGLLATSALLRKGHRLRLSIAGADCDTFPVLFKDKRLLYRVQRNGNHPSSIDLPVVPRASSA